MPLLKHAKKKLRQDIKRTVERKKLKTLYKSLIKKAKEEPSPTATSAAFKAIDKAAKKNLMHDNRAAHLKSALSKVTTDTPSIKATVAKKSLTKTARAKINKAATTKAKASKSPSKNK